jgi:hypothetical protein
LINQTGVGLGAYEFQVKYDHKVFDLAIEDGGFLGSTGRAIFCTTDFGVGVTENYIYFGCVSAGLLPNGSPAPGPMGDTGPANPAGYKNANDAYNTGFIGNGPPGVCGQTPPIPTSPPGQDSRWRSSTWSRTRTCTSASGPRA